MHELPPRVAASRDLLVLSVFDGRPYEKAQAKLHAVKQRWVTRQLLLMLVAWLGILFTPKEGPPAWLLALVYSTIFTAMLIWLWPERQAKARLARLTRRAKRIDDRRRAEGRVVMRIH